MRLGGEGNCLQASTFMQHPALKASHGPPHTPATNSSTNPPTHGPTFETRKNLTPLPSRAEKKSFLGGGGKPPPPPPFCRLLGRQNPPPHPLAGAAGENASAPEQAKSRAAIEAADLHCEMLAQASRLQPSPGSVYRPLRPTACRRLAVKQPVAYKCSPVRSSTATRRV